MIQMRPFQRYALEDESKIGKNAIGQEFPIAG
jgi:hypothetical protein